MTSKVEKLSDYIEWDDAALHLLESLMVRMRAAIADEAIMTTYRQNRLSVSRGTILSVLHQTKPITYFVDEITDSENKGSDK